MAAENTALPLQEYSKDIKTEIEFFFICTNITQSYCFYCIFALVNIKKIYI